VKPFSLLDICAFLLTFLLLHAEGLPLREQHQSSYQKNPTSNFFSASV
jgi:hypothetical protein